MNKIIGICVRVRAGLKIFWAVNFWLVGAALLAGFPLKLAADPLGFLPHWNEGTTWQLKSIHRQIDGSWSQPMTWTFEVMDSDGSVYAIQVKGEGSSSVKLLFAKQTGQLQTVLLSDIIRGRSALRCFEIQGIGPVAPMFSVIPYHTPVFLQSPDTSVRYHLEVMLNSKPLPSLECGQRVDRLDDFSLLLSTLPETAKPDMQSFKGPDQLFLVEIIQKDKTLFKQIWGTGLPWALWTETRDIKAWLVR